MRLALALCAAVLCLGCEQQADPLVNDGVPAAEWVLLRDASGQCVRVSVRGGGHYSMSAYLWVESMKPEACR
jgi:hypothetical protein